MLTWARFPDFVGLNYWGAKTADWTYVASFEDGKLGGTATAKYARDPTAQQEYLGQNLPSLSAAKALCEAHARKHP